MNTPSTRMVLAAAGVLASLTSAAHGQFARFDRPTDTASYAVTQGGATQFGWSIQARVMFTGDGFGQIWGEWQPSVMDRHIRASRFTLSGFAFGVNSAPLTVNFATPLERGRWYHLQYDVNLSWERLYVDGVQVALRPVTQSRTTGWSAIATRTIGGVFRDGALTPAFPGMVDWIAFSDDADVNSFVPPVAAPATFLNTATWRMDEVASTTVLGDSNNSRNYEATLGVGFTGATRPLIAGCSLPPIWLTQPTTVSVRVGQTINLSSLAAGGSVSYQWFRNGVPLAGATSRTLSISNAQLTNGGLYTVRATDAVCSFTLIAESSATVQVLNCVNAPTITQQPQPQIIRSGETLTLSVAATAGVSNSGPNTLAYQWYRNDQPIVTATQATYTVPGAPSALSGNYRCVVTDLACGQSLNSSTVLVQVADCNVPTVISQQPQDIQIGLGGSGSLTVAATGPSTVTYQWRRNGVPLAGQTGTTLNFSNFTLLDYGNYDVVATTICGSATSRTVAIVAPPADAITDYYAGILRASIASEIVRSQYGRNPNLRLVAVSTALGIIAEKNPRATADQLSAWMTAYDNLLQAAFPGDPNLRGPLNFQTAVRFRARVTSVPGLDTDIGEAVLDRLNLPTTGGTSSEALSNFSFSTAASFVSSARWGWALRNTFEGKDAGGGFNPHVAALLASYVRGLGFEPYPPTPVIAVVYPEIFAALGQLPTTGQQFADAQRTNFAGIRAIMLDSLVNIRLLGNQAVEQFNATRQSFSSVEATIAAASNQTAVNAALAQRDQFRQQIAEERSLLAMTGRLLGEGGPAEQILGQRAEYVGGLQLQFADSTYSTVGTAISGAGSIISGIAGITGAEGPMGVVSGVFSIISGAGTLLPLFEPDSNTPPVEQQLADAIQGVRNQVIQLQNSMNARFDRTDALIQSAYSGLSEGMQRLEGLMRGTATAVSDVQLTMASVQTNLSRMERNLYSILNDQFNQQFALDANQALGYRARFGIDMPYTGGGSFTQFESSFNQYAATDVRNTALGGPDLISNDSSTGSALLGFELASGINMLRNYPSILGLPVLASSRVANPIAWAFTANAYTQLGRENPWYFRMVAPSRLEQVLATGTASQNAMNAGRSAPLFTRLLSDADARVAGLQTAINQHRQAWLEATGLAHIDLFGGPSQVPITRSPTAAVGTPGFPRPALPPNLPVGAPLNNSASQLSTPMVADGLLWTVLPPEIQLACTLQGFNTGGGQYGFANWTLRLNVDRGMFFQDPPPGPCAVVYLEIIHQPTGTLVARRGLSFCQSFNSIDVHAYVADQWLNTPDRLRDRFVPANLNAPEILNAAFFNQIRASNAEILRQQQRAWLQAALGAFASATSVKTNGDLVESSRVLLDSYASLSMPESTQYSEVIRAALKGTALAFGSSAAQSILLSARDSLVAPGTAPLTTPPAIGTELTRRINILRTELNAALAVSRVEQHPSVKWALASGTELQTFRNRLAEDDQYLMSQGSTLVVPAANGLLANDAEQPGATSRTVAVVTPPSVGTLDLQPSGGFTFTPPPGFTGSVSFTYAATAVVSTGQGSTSGASTPATVRIDVGPCLPVISRQPRNVQFQAGGTLLLDVGVTANSQVAYQWRRNGQPLPEGGRLRGTTGPSLMIINAGSGDRGTYEVVVTSFCGAVTSLPVNLGSASCSVADVTGIGGPPAIADGLLTGDDFNAFIAAFAAGESLADITGIGGPPAVADGLITGDDFNAFIAAFAAGCP